MSRPPLAFRLILGPELALWARAGHAPVIWWRDDDARAPTWALEHLLSLSRRHAAPLTLAAIAGPGLPLLARRVRTEPQVEVAVHGFRHVNRHPAGQGAGEIVDGDDSDWIQAQLRATVTLFQRAGLAPTLFVPPWNNLKPRLVALLPCGSITAVSAFDQDRSASGGVLRLDAHLDVLRWKNGGRFRGTWRFLSRMRRLMVQRRRSGRWDEPMGLLTHHLDHDKATWLFLEQFLAAFPVTARLQLTGDATVPAEALIA